MSVLRLNNKKIDKIPTTNIILKIPDLNLLSKIKLNSHNKNKNLIGGNVLMKKNKQKFTGTFNYKNDKIKINNQI